MTSNRLLGYWAEMNPIKSLVLASAVLILAGCGSREALQPRPGEAMPPAPAMATRAPTMEELLTPPPIAKPQRLDETLIRSEEREDDRFDLPPPS